MSKTNAHTGRTERAAAALEAERRRNRNRQLLGVGGIVAVLVVIVVVLTLVLQKQDATSEVTTVPPAGANDYSLPVGDPDAPHDVVVYEDFLCPFCGEFEAASRDDLTQLAEDGQVYLEYRPLNFLSRIGDYSERATNAFAAVLDQEGPATAKEFHDRLFENQPGESGPFPDDAALIDLAVSVGADEATITPAVEDLAFESWVAGATDQASKAGVNATPTILLDGKPFEDGTTVEDLAANLAAAIQE